MFFILFSVSKTLISHRQSRIFKGESSKPCLKEGFKFGFVVGIQIRISLNMYHAMQDFCVTQKPPLHKGAGSESVHRTKNGFGSKFKAVPIRADEGCFKRARISKRAFGSIRQIENGRNRNIPIISAPPSDTARFFGKTATAAIQFIKKTYTGRISPFFTRYSTAWSKSFSEPVSVTKVCTLPLMAEISASLRLSSSSERTSSSKSTGYSPR